MADEPVLPSVTIRTFNRFVFFMVWYLVSGFLGAFLVLFFVQIPEGNRETVVYMLGQLTGFTGAAVGFLYSTTYQSGEKTKMLAQSQPIKTE